MLGTSGLRLGHPSPDIHSALSFLPSSTPRRSSLEEDGLEINRYVQVSILSLLQLINIFILAATVVFQRVRNKVQIPVIELGCQRDLQASHNELESV